MISVYYKYILSKEDYNLLINNQTKRSYNM